VDAVAPTLHPAVPMAGDTATAEELLATIASIRRSVRRLPGRPGVLSSLNGSQLELVRLVRRRPGVSVADAAEELRLAPNTVSTLVGQLTEAGLMLRRPDASDRRVARLDLDAEMRRRVDAWHDRRVLGVADAAQLLSAGDRRRLVAAIPVLARLADALLTAGPGERALLDAPGKEREVR
jgi:DNA-binding MarR family transcriptional regulator